MILSTEGLSQVTSHKRPDATKSLGLVTVEDKLDVAFTLHRRFDKVQFRSKLSVWTEGLW